MDDHQFHQYQQNKQLPLILTELIDKQLTLILTELIGHKIPQHMTLEFQVLA